MGFSGMDWRNLFGGLAGGAAKDLGYQDLYVQKKPNAAPTKGILPSQQALGKVVGDAQGAPVDMMGQGQPGTMAGQFFDHPIQLNAMGMFGKGVPPPIRTYAYGGSLDPNSINIVSDDEHVTKDGKVVSTGDDEEKAKRQAHEDAIAATLGKVIQAAQQAQTVAPPTQSSPQDQVVSPPPSESGVYMNQIATSPHGQIGFTPPPMTLGQQAPTTSQAPSITGNPLVRVPTLNGPDWKTMLNNADGSVASDTSPAQQTPTQDDLIKALYGQVQQDYSMKPTKAWKSALYGALQGFSNAANHTNNPVQTWDEVRRNRALSRDVPRLQAALGMRDSKTASELKQAQIFKDQQDAYESNARAGKLQADIVHQQNEDKLKGQEWEPFVQSNKVWKKFKDGSTRPFIDPDTGKQAEHEERVTVPNPMGGGGYKVDPKTALTNQTNLAVGNVHTQNDFAKFNSEKQFETDKTNVANQMKYADDTRQVMTKIAEVGSQLLAGQPALQSQAEQITNLAQQAAELNQGFNDPALDESTRNHLVSQMDGLQKQLASAQKGFYADLGKSQGGAAVLSQLKGLIPKEPKRLSFTPISPTQAGVQTASEADARKYFAGKGLTGDALEKAIEAGKQAGRIQ